MTIKIQRFLNTTYDSIPTIYPHFSPLLPFLLQYVDTTKCGWKRKNSWSSKFKTISNWWWLLTTDVLIDHLILTGRGVKVTSYGFNILNPKIDGRQEISRGASISHGIAAADDKQQHVTSPLTNGKHRGVFLMAKLGPIGKQISGLPSSSKPHWQKHSRSTKE